MNFLSPLRKLHNFALQTKISGKLNRQMLRHLPVIILFWERTMRHTHGSIEVVCGSMFSGKTDELIRRMRRAVIARQKVQVFKPAIDVRYAVEKVTSHAGADFDAIPVEQASAIFDKLEADTTVVGVDEAQFFDEGIISVTRKLAD